MDLVGLVCRHIGVVVVVADSRGLVELGYRRKVLELVKLVGNMGLVELECTHIGVVFVEFVVVADNMGHVELEYKHIEGLW